MHTSLADPIHTGRAIAARIATSRSMSQDCVSLACELQKHCVEIERHREKTKTDKTLLAQFQSALEALQAFLPPSILLPEEGDGELLTSLVSGCQSAYKLAKLLQDVLKAISLLLPFNHIETAALNLGRASPMEQTPRILVTRSPGQTRKQEVQLSGPSPNSLEIRTLEDQRRHQFPTLTSRSNSPEPDAQAVHHSSSKTHSRVRSLRLSNPKHLSVADGVVGPGLCAMALIGSTAVKIK